MEIPRGSHVNEGFPKAVGGITPPGVGPSYLCTRTSPETTSTSPVFSFIHRYTLEQLLNQSCSLLNYILLLVHTFFSFSFLPSLFLFLLLLLPQQQHSTLYTQKQPTMKSTTRYAAVPQSTAEDIHYAPSATRRVGASRDEEEGDGSGCSSLWCERAKKALYLSSLVALALVMGFCLGRNHEHLTVGGGGHRSSQATPMTGAKGGLLPPQALIPESMFVFTLGGCTDRLFCRWNPQGKKELGVGCDFGP